MKLLQLNAWGGRLEPQIGDLIAGLQPDIICLQEIISYEGSGTGLFITVEMIQQKYDFPFVAFSPTFSFNFMKGTARFGNCVLSRLPIGNSETVFTHLDHKENFTWGDDNSNVRNFVHATTEINGVTGNIITHHGFWVPEHKNGNDETQQQMDILADYVAKLHGPVIVAGDFNLAPSSPSLNRLNTQLTNLSLQAGLQTTRTELTHKTETCDYIFVSDEIQVKHFGAMDKIASDHKALLLDFEIKT